jgi:hypothetical protein
LDGRLWPFAFVLVESSPSDRLQVRFFVQEDCRARDAEGGKRALGAFLIAGVLRVVAQQCTFLHHFPLSLHRWTIVLDAACVLSGRWPRFPLRVAVPRKAPARHINRSDPVPGSDSARSIAAWRARWADQSSVLLFVAWPEKEAKRQSAGMHRFLELARRVRQLEKKVGQLSAPNT